MTRAPRKYKYSWFVIACLGAMTTIVLCNLWMLCCGRGVPGDYLNIPPVGWVLIAANLCAGVVFVLLKRRKDKRPIQNFCNRCSVVLRESWAFCPKCGDTHNH